MGVLDLLALFAIARMRGRFERAEGRPVEFSASGFWLVTNDAHLLYITNRHNIDPTLKHGEGTQLALAGVELQVRDAADGTSRFHAVTNLAASVWVAPSADCALLADPTLAGAPYLDPARVFKEENLAEAALFGALQITDAASFIGFPGLRGHPWWDQVADAPIARLAAVASIPSIEFRNDAVKTADVLLVSGLSFSGSSGSPVLNQRKGIPPGGDIHDASYVPSKIVGIMSGHFWENPDDAPEMFRHSGLSYLTRSTSILNLIATARATGFARPA